MFFQIAVVVLLILVIALLRDIYKALQGVGMALLLQYSAPQGGEKAIETLQKLPGIRAVQKLLGLNEKPNDGDGL